MRTANRAFEIDHERVREMVLLMYETMYGDLVQSTRTYNNGAQHTVARYYEVSGATMTVVEDTPDAARRHGGTAARTSHARLTRLTHVSVLDDGRMARVVGTVTTQGSVTLMLLPGVPEAD